MVEPLPLLPWRPSQFPQPLLRLARRQPQQPHLVGGEYQVATCGRHLDERGLNGLVFGVGWAVLGLDLFAVDMGFTSCTSDDNAELMSARLWTSQYTLKAPMGCFQCLRHRNVFLIYFRFCVFFQWNLGIPDYKVAYLRCSCA